MDSQSLSHDKRIIWTKKLLRGLSQASLGAPVTASSTLNVDGGLRRFFFNFYCQLDR